MMNKYGKGILYAVIAAVACAALELSFALSVGENVLLAFARPRCIIPCLGAAALTGVFALLAEKNWNEAVR